MRAAAVQLNSNADKARNLAAAERLVRAAAADGAELVALPEKWNLLAAGEDLVAGAEALDGPSLTAARGWARDLGLHLLAGSIAERGEAEKRLQHLGPDRPRRRGPRHLPQDPHVRRRRRRRLLPRVRARAARRGDRHRPARRADARPQRLLRPALPGAVPHPRAARRPPPRRPLGLHRGHRPRPLGGAAAGAGDREPGLRPRPQPGRHGAAALRLLRPLGDRRPLGEGAGDGARRRECFVAADLDLGAQDRVRQELPSLANRRPRAYVWPQLAEARA